MKIIPEMRRVHWYYSWWRP